MSKTIQEAVIGLASKVKGAAVTPTNATIASALDTLADALAGEDVQARPTIAGAIDAITANYTPGGGGGPTLGAQTYIFGGDTAPEPGGYITDTLAIGGVAIGSTTVVENGYFNAVLSVAAGAAATTTPDFEGKPTNCDAYVVTVEAEDFTAVEPWGGTLTPSTFGEDNVWSFTVPALEFDVPTATGQILFLHRY